MKAKADVYTVVPSLRERERVSRWGSGLEDWSCSSMPPRKPSDPQIRGLIGAVEAGGW